MRIVLVTAQPKYRGGWLQEAKAALALEDGDWVGVLAVQPPRTPREVDRFVVVDPSTVPFRPAVDFPVRGREARGRTPFAVRALRAGRNVWHRVAGHPAPERLAHHLAVACRTSRLPARLAREADVVVALDDAAALGVWHLARRVDGPVFVQGLDAARDAMGRRLPATDGGPDQQDDTASTSEAPTRMPEVAPASVSLLIAPLNRWKQGRAWAQAVVRHVPDASAQSFSASGVVPGSDLAVDPFTFAADLEWRRYWRRHVIDTYTHVLAETGLPILGATLSGVEDQYVQLQRAGLSVARVAHGAEVRVPSIDAESNPWAPYGSMTEVTVRQLEGSARRLVTLFRAHEGPVYVSAAGLRTFLPDATWLPLTLDIDEWTSEHPLLAGQVPVVAHAPGRVRPGTPADVEPLLQALDHDGVIEYRRVGDVSAERRRAAYGTADLVIEQLETADYGQPACEALALGRVVVGHVDRVVREHIAGVTGTDLPIVEADPSTLESAIRALVVDRPRAVELAGASRDYAAKVHSGAFSAAVLSPWLSATNAPS
ncbi:hypothetical protein [Aeromicrobium sp.]|uniref:hypothetical protein n=1 Tax=Aeromicrobium sp. TaxID=1871063 RepID=UPI0028B0EA17|nr:hypothetical protein [Aeromicrobium sp.]